MRRTPPSGLPAAAPRTRYVAHTASSFEACTEAGDWVAVHAGPDPRAEALRLLATVPADDPPVVVIIAAGLGYLAEAAAARWRRATLVVVEPDAAVAAAARRRLPGLYDAARMRLLVGPAYEGAEEIWRVFDRSGGAVDAPPMLADPVLARAWPARVREAARLVGRAVAAARMNAEARAQNGGRYLVNTLRNARHLVLGPNPAGLAGRFPNVPAIVVGAGPSLTRTMPALRRLADRALVIATDTAWRPLVAAGVHPHLVVAVDPTPENGRHLRHVPEAPGTWIIAEASVDPPSLAPHAGRVAPFRVAAHQPWPWLIAHGFDTVTLRAWGSVLTPAFDLALMCGCAPVVFVGADLAFTDGRPYCRGTTMEDEWARHTARGVTLRQVWANTLASRPLVTLPSITGALVQTAPHLVEFRDWIAARAAEVVPGRVVNASGDGILFGAGVTLATLDEVLASRPVSAGHVEGAIRGALAAPQARAHTAGLVQALRAVACGSADADAMVASWLTAGGPTLTSEALRLAARDAADALAAPLADVPADRPAPPGRWFAGDRAAFMRAQLTGDRSGLDGTDPPAPRAVVAAAEAARAAYAGLFALHEIATGPGPDVEAGAAPQRVPLSQRYRWTGNAAPLVAALEEAFLEVSAAPAGRGDSAAVDWRAQAPPPREGDAGARPSVDAGARAAVAAMHLAVETSVDVEGSLSRREARLLAAAAGALEMPGWIAPGAAGVDVQVHGRRRRLPLVAQALIRAVTGTIVEAQDGLDPAEAFLRDAVCEIAPDVLTGGDVPRGWSVVTLSEATALFVPAGTPGSLVIRTGGPLEPASAWPGPITGEMPWGAEGGRLAWNARTRDVYWHVDQGAAIASARAPFTPAHVASLEGEPPVWTGTDARLWRWRPGDEARLLATLPEPGIPRYEGAALLVAPMPRDASGRSRRLRLDREWHVEPHTGEVDRRPCGGLGQCARVASSGGWTAATHPFADVVRLTADGGWVGWLACDTPLGVAWAGASLVVTLASGELLRFPRLRTTLTGCLTGSPLAV